MYFLETDRLLLRPPKPQDAEHDIAYMKSARAKFETQDCSKAATMNLIISNLEHWVSRGFGLMSIEEKSTGHYCGYVGIWQPKDITTPEMSWRLLEAAEGRGIAYEAAHNLKVWAFDVKGWDKIVSYIHKDNLRSKSLARRLSAVYVTEAEIDARGVLGVWEHRAP